MFFLECVGGQVVNGKSVGYPIILEGCYADLIYADSLNKPKVSYNSKSNE